MLDHLPELVQLASQIAEVLLLLHILLFFSSQFASAFVLYHVYLSLVVRLLVVLCLL